MALPTGSTIPLSPMRRLMCEFMHLSRKVPLVAIERQCDLGEVIAVRRWLARRPSWFAVFMKAYALVAARRPQLRRSYLSFPWPRLHQHECNVGAVAIARRVGDEDGVLPLQIRDPEKLSLLQLDAIIQRARTEPVENIGDFRRCLRFTRMPWFLRRLALWAGSSVCGDWRARFFGTFGVTGVAALGAQSLHLLSPLTTTLTYGVFRDDGTAPVRLFYDHRVMDGVEPAETLAELEEVLQSRIVDELAARQSKAA